MSDTTQEAFKLGDVAAIGSVIAGGLTILLVLFLPGRDLFIAIVGVLVTIALAVTGGSRATARWTASLARLGALAGIAAAIMLVIDGIMRN